MFTLGAALAERIDTRSSESPNAASLPVEPDSFQFGCRFRRWAKGYRDGVVIVFAANVLTMFGLPVHEVFQLETVRITSKLADDIPCQKGFHSQKISCFIHSIIHRPLLHYIYIFIYKVL